MSKELVKLPREVRDAIEKCRVEDISDYGIVCLTLYKQEDSGFSPSVLKSLKALRTWTFSDMEDEDLEWKVSDHHGPSRADNLLKALVNGYEVEESPEDKVREWYQGLQSQLDSGVNGPYREQVVRELTTIDKCIRLLNIKIEGVNA